MQEKKAEVKDKLPIFRKDLKLFKGPNDVDGSPTYNLYDPVRVQFFKVTWPESFIFRYLKPGMTPDELIRKIEETSTLRLTNTEVMQFFEIANRNNLLALPKTSKALLEEAKKKETSWFKWLIFNYLYIRVPLFHPDKFLKTTLKYVQFLASKWAFFIYAILTLIGLYKLIGRLDEYTHTFTYFFNAQGIAFYAGIIIFVKIIHELSHAYTAKYFGIRVPTMGVVFIVLWPALYTDVTDSWKLKDRKERFKISLAGVMAELVIAGICTFGWSLSKPGLLQSTFFVLSSVSIFSSLLININPALRFDGYYLLSDLWGIENLQMRAFSVTRWKLREWFLGLDVPAPEENLTRKRIFGLIAYSIFTWIYRIFLYTAIALFVYHKFAKTIGIFLFLIEIGIFLLWPIFWEFSQWRLMKSYFKLNWRLALTASLLVLGFTYFALPLTHYKRVSAVIIPNQNQLIYSPYESQIKKINISRGKEVKKGDVLIELFSPGLDFALSTEKAQRKIIEKQVSILETTSEERAYLGEKNRELALSSEKIKRLTENKNEMTLKAEFDGIIYEFDPDLKIGQAIRQGEVLGKAGNFNQFKALLFVPEAMMNQIDLHEKVTFISKNFEKLSGEITRISPVRSRELIYPALASIYTGALPVQQDLQNALILQDSYYQVEATLDKTDLPLKVGEAGDVEITLERHSYLMDWVRYFVNLFWKEGGF